MGRGPGDGANTVIVRLSSSTAVLVYGGVGTLRVRHNTQQQKRASLAAPVPSSRFRHAYMCTKPATLAQLMPCGVMASDTASTLYCNAFVIATGVADTGSSADSLPTGSIILSASCTIMLRQTNSEVRGDTCSYARLQDEAGDVTRLTFAPPMRNTSTSSHENVLVEGDNAPSTP